MNRLKATSAWVMASALCLLCTIASAEQIQASWRAQVIELAKANFKHSAWGFSHSVRDYDLAKSLARQDKVELDDDVLFAAAYLHDIAMFSDWQKPGVDHADQAAAIVDTVLTGIGFASKKIDTVRLAIKTHMFNREPAGPESVYLHDADALDWLGAIGIVRTFSMIDANGGQPDARKMVGVLEDYIENVPTHVMSPSGKVLAIERNAEAERYLTQLNSESANFNSL